MDKIAELTIPAIVIGVAWAAVAMWLCSILGSRWGTGRLFLLIVVFPALTLAFGLLAYGLSPSGWIFVILGLPAAIVATVTVLRPGSRR